MRKVYGLLCVISTITIVWVTAQAAYCQSSANYQIEWSVLDGGGGERNSDSYDVFHSIGQTAGGQTSLSGSYANRSGVYAGNRMRGVPISPITPDPDDPVPSPVPEQSTVVLLGVGIIGILALGRKRQKGGSL